jgi:hypothetical protein
LCPLPKKWDPCVWHSEVYDENLNLEITTETVMEISGRVRLTDCKGAEKKMI